MLEIGNAILEFLSMYVDLSFSSNSHEFEILSYWEIHIAENGAREIQKINN